MNSMKKYINFKQCLNLLKIVISILIILYSGFILDILKKLPELNIMSVYGLDSDLSGGGNGYGDENSSYGYGVTAHVGYRVYCLSSDGSTLQNKAIDLFYSNTSADIENEATQLGILISDKFMDCPIPKCINDSGSNWSSNYEEVRDFLYQESERNGEQIQNAITIVYDYLGEDIADEFLKSTSNVYLCIEPIFRMGIFTNGSPSSFAGTFYGTTRNWGNLFLDNNINNQSFLGIGVCQSMPQSMFIQNDYENLGLYAPQVTEGLLTPEEVSTYAYGIGLFWNHDIINTPLEPPYPPNPSYPQETQSTHTYDNSLGTQPGRAPIPPESEGSKIICKVYTDPSDQSSQDLVYWRTQNPSVILIEDEPDYKVTEWLTSTSDEIQLERTWSSLISNITHIQTGTTPEQVSLSEEENSLYILLEKQPVPHEKPEGIDLVITESKITTLEKNYDWGITRKYEFNLDLQDHTDWCSPIISNPPCSDGVSESLKLTIYNQNVGMDEDYKNYLDGSKSLSSVNQILINQWTQSHMGSTTRKTEPSIETESGNTNDVYIQRLNDQLTLRTDSSTTPSSPKAWEVYSDEPNLSELVNEETVKATLDTSSSQAEAQTSRRTGEVGECDYILNLKLYTSDEDGVLDLYQKKKDCETYHTLSSLCSHVYYDEEGNEHIEHPLYTGESESIDFETNKQVLNFKDLFRVLVETYVGNQTSHSAMNPKEFRKSTTTLSSSGSLKSGIEEWGTRSEVLTYNFVPYIMMTYTSPTVQSSEVINKANLGNQYQKLQKVSSQWIRDNQTQTYAETYFTSKNSMSLITGLWATDASLILNNTNEESKNWKQLNRVLKFGSPYQLEGSNTVTGKSYQTFQTEEQLDELKQAHTDYIESLVDGLKSKHIELHVSKDWKDNPYTSGVVASHGNLLPSEDMETGKGFKYALNSEGASSGEADSAKIDAKQINTNYMYHKLSSDYQGNIYYISSSDLSSLKEKQGTKVGNKNSTSTSIAASSSKLNELETKFNFVSRFLESFERNTGNDSEAPWSPDGRWYNESTEIYLLESTSNIEVKVDLRTVTNGIITGEMSSKFNEDEIVAYQAGWCLEDITEPIAYFRNTGVKLNNSKYLLYSNTFYAVNMSVTDVH